MSQRSNFRFEAFQVNPVSVTIHPSGRTLSGEPLFIYPEGLRALFSDSKSLGVTLGSKLELEFCSCEWSTPISVLCQLQSRHDQNSIRELGFCFIKRKEVDENLLPRLRALFNRRKATRVTPDPKHPVEVYLDGTTTGRAIQGRLLDLSGSGLLMHAPLDCEANIVDAKDCRVSFHLPGVDPIGLSLFAHIRERRLVSSSIQLGLEFDPLRTATFPSQQERIMEYVMQRQPRTPYRLRTA
jgi:hypothetical protein